ncbi:hypothetical protein J5069_24050 [Candidatus Symbiopectobacterium sp. NZEC127]|nr:hypothetical protein [Candidatus Symbiopectobacterium sp. NZEC135]MCW2488951.1 hypothetical protein [Candidatus Symbiopectobacterium sp. NZEC127]
MCMSNITTGASYAASGGSAMFWFERLLNGLLCIAVVAGGMSVGLRYGLLETCQTWQRLIPCMDFGKQQARL